MLEILAAGFGAMVAWLVGLGILFVFLGLAVFVIFFIFWIKAIIEIITARNSSEWKIIWLLVVIFLHVLGLILYYVIAHKEAKIKKRNN